MVVSPSHWIMLWMLGKLPAQTIFYGIWVESPALFQTLFLRIHDILWPRRLTDLCTFEQLLLCRGNLVCLACPGLQYRSLQCTAIAEGESPWLTQRLGAPVDGVQMDGGILLRLTARQEGDAGDGRGYGALQGCDGGPGYINGAVLLSRVRLAGGDHVGFEKGTLQEDVVVSKGLVLEGQHLMGNRQSSVITLR